MHLEWEAIKIDYLCKTYQNGNIRSTAGRIDNSQAVTWLNLSGGFFDSMWKNNLEDLEKAPKGLDMVRPTTEEN